MYPRETGSRALEPLTAGQAEMAGESIVARCEARTCLFNQARHCTAGAIELALNNGMPQCATFAPRGDIVPPSDQTQNPLDRR